MPLPESSLSIICASIGDYVRNGVNAATNNITVSIAAPAEVAEDDDQHRINLFFYRFEPAGIQSSVRPDEFWHMRMYCLITTFGIDEDDIPAGENDLRMLGEVMRIFHERPVLAAVNIGTVSVRLQVVFTPVTDEQINQIWSTQSDTVYRPSVLYELALAPVIPSQLRTEPPLVGSLGHQVFGDPAQRYSGFSGNVSGPRVPLRRVDIANPQWVPQICWIYQNTCVQTLSFDIDSPEFAGFSPDLWIAGDSGENVSLVWEVWDSNGWRQIGAPHVVTPFNDTIDPVQIPAPVPGLFPETLPLPLPVTIPVDENAAQGLLYATRSIVVIEGQPAVEIRSNPLLISLYRTT
ncbi:Protein of unknown function [Nitrosomonas marina]|uniref:Pvc16 N-terminal domain-containing protein n=1 Tax=Nitrosomonas marina TaxID=917 RepID=A0A1I0BKB9_9PROT|nr:DUF4255 domain-containing protein [Nitrosomonas marina]SET07383.1 Protein of unknown function [Nitrosomonas marina]